MKRRKYKYSFCGGFLFFFLRSHFSCLVCLKLPLFPIFKCLFELNKKKKKEKNNDEKAFLLENRRWKFEWDQLPRATSFFFLRRFLFGFWAMHMWLFMQASPEDVSLSPPLYFFFFLFHLGCGGGLCACPSSLHARKVSMRAMWLIIIGFRYL